MVQQNLADMVNALTPAEQAAVREFIEFLHTKDANLKSPFLAAVDEFIEQHPELLQRLAQ